MLQKLQFEAEGETIQPEVASADIDDGRLAYARAYQPLDGAYVVRIDHTLTCTSSFG
jgi:hypothetical protein